jgi:hypothetical protein
MDNRQIRPQEARRGLQHVFVESLNRPLRKRV